MEIEVTSENETMSFAQQLAAEIKPGTVLGLVGDLGAGKTHFVKGLARGLGSSTPVASPTFTLVHEYRDGSSPLYHFDFYRAEQLEEIVAIGWEEYLDEEGIVVVEWADRFPDLMPEQTQWWQIKILSEETRRILKVDGCPEKSAMSSRGGD